MSDFVEFTLPFGYETEGRTYRKGRMHLATTGDELAVQEDDQIGLNARFRDILLLARVIDELEGLGPVTPDIIKNLYEPDFIYLQLLYRHLNGDIDTSITARCPVCGTSTEINLTDLYTDMEIYRK